MEARQRLGRDRSKRELERKVGRREQGEKVI